jgi:hypothetical protein
MQYTGPMRPHMKLDKPTPGEPEVHYNMPGDGISRPGDTFLSPYGKTTIGDWNKYRYAENRPTVLIDPSGLQGQWGNYVPPEDEAGTPDVFDRVYHDLLVHCTFQTLPNTPERQNCLNDISRVLQALRTTREQIAEEGGPTIFSYGGETCDECALRAQGVFGEQVMSYFSYRLQICEGYASIGGFGVGIHVWGELVVKKTDAVVGTIDFWEIGLDDFWRRGQFGFGWYPGYRWDDPDVWQFLLPRIDITPPPPRRLEPWETNPWWGVR